MTREVFAKYRQAFDGLLACGADAQRTKEQCVDSWFRNVRALASGVDSGYAHDMMGYYLDTSLHKDPAKIAKLYRS